MVEILLQGNFGNPRGREVERSREPLPCSTSFVTSLPNVTLAVLFVNRRSMRPHLCKNELWFSTLTRLKKKNVNRLISVGGMRVALAACLETWTSS